MKVMGLDYSDRIAWRRAERDVVAMADEITSHIPRMWRSCSTPDEFWFWYVGELDSVIRQSRDTGERLVLKSRFEAALRQAGVVPPVP